jgi:hypothetical protein
MSFIWLTVWLLAGTPNVDVFDMNGWAITFGIALLIDFGLVVFYLDDGGDWWIF